jgi:lincosamide nucleotidyltransferase A/C/D/E
MTLESLVELLDVLDSEKIEAWLDGGWGVDALLGEQTRPHKDVDLIVRVGDLARLASVLRRRGYEVVPGGTPANMVFRNAAALEIDIHAVEFDASGNGNYLMANGEYWSYPAEGFSGGGSVGGRAVRCLTAEVQVLGHATGYTPDAKDINDMERLRARFGVPVPMHLQRRD